MILIVTNREDYTADFLILELQRRGAHYCRLNTEDFPHRATMTWRASVATTNGTLDLPSGPLTLSDVRSIWYRRPVPPVPSREVTDPVSFAFAVAETEAALDGLLRTTNCFWVSDPDRIRRAECKPFQLALAAKLGFAIPETIITNDPSAAQEFIRRQEAAVYKPLRQGRVIVEDELQLIYTNVVRNETAHWESVAYAPCLFQGYVKKSLEVRATVIGHRVLAVAIHSQESERTLDDWRRQSADLLRHEPHDLPANVNDLCLKLVEALGLAFGAIDLIRTPAGEYVFLEINPNGQWAWLQQLCPEVPLRESLADLLMATDQQ